MYPKVSGIHLATLSLSLSLSLSLYSLSLSLTHTHTQVRKDILKKTVFILVYHFSSQYTIASIVMCYKLCQVYIANVAIPALLVPIA
jgi:hypothetical protein